MEPNQTNPASKKKVEDIKITCIDDLIKIVQNISKDVEDNDIHHAHLRMWFRGQSDAAWKLIPGVYRPEFTPINECDRFELEKHLSQDFRALAVARLSGQETPVELYFLQQHYGMPTRLLDWTSNSLVALWFTVENEMYHPKTGKDRKNCSKAEECDECKKCNEGQDGKVSMMDVYQMESDLMPKNFGIASPRHPVFKEALNLIIEWGEFDKFPKYIIPVRPDHRDWRIRQQESFFTFHVPDAPGGKLSTENAALTTKHNRSLVSHIVPKEKKRAIKTTLSMLGINAFTVYGDLNNLSKGLVEAYITRFKNKQPTPEDSHNITPIVAGSDQHTE